MVFLKSFYKRQVLNNQRDKPFTYLNHWERIHSFWLHLFLSLCCFNTSSFLVSCKRKAEKRRKVHSFAHRPALIPRVLSHHSCVVSTKLSWKRPLALLDQTIIPRSLVKLLFLSERHPFIPVFQLLSVSSLFCSESSKAPAIPFAN